MFLVVLAVRLQRCNYAFKLSNLTYEGTSLFPNRTVGYSLIVPGFHPPDPFLQLAPPGTVLVSEDAQPPLLLNFESSVSFSGRFHHFSPSTMFSFPLLDSLAVIPVNHNLSVLRANLTVFPGTAGGILELVTLIGGDDCQAVSVTASPFLYRTLTGNITGLSRTVIRRGTEVDIFEPLPNFCVRNRHSIESNCSAVTFSEVDSVLHVSPSAGACQYSYQYRCRFPHWAAYPTNPDRGFLLGPVVARDAAAQLHYGNAPVLLLPTPDFSMVYNTPIIVGFVFSFTFAFVIRMLMAAQ
jgi:hypothetical protein